MSYSSTGIIGSLHAEGLPVFRLREDLEVFIAQLDPGAGALFLP
jgi:hypothetical protein